MSKPISIDPNKIRTIGVLGCGGTGSHVATGIARLEIAIRSLGGEFPDVTLMDHDIVEPPNIGRQLYTEHDIGTLKCTALAQRINAGYGLSWESSSTDIGTDLNLVCVDSRKARANIYSQCEDRYEGYTPPYFLDFGNTNNTGQVVFGGGKDIPIPSKQYPELVDTSIKETNQPSCSLAEALESQELYVNQFVASFGLQILWQIFRRGRINQRGFFINLDGCSIPIPV